MMESKPVNGKGGPAGDLIVKVKTGNRLTSGTLAKVKLSLINSDGEKSDGHEINLYWWNYLSVGSTREIQLSGLGNFGHVSAIEINKGKSLVLNNWYVEWLMIKNEVSGDCSVFPIHRWIYANQPVLLKEYDAYLPQHDEDPKLRRKEELEELRKIYTPQVNVEGMLCQVAELPWQEKFSLAYTLSIVSLKYKLKLHLKLQDFLYGEWSDYDEVKRLYNSYLQLPTSSAFWRTDEAFGEQRLNHCNPTQIRLCKTIPGKFAVTEEMMNPLLEGLTIQEAIDAKKLYYIDYAVLKDLECPNNRVVCAPFGLFFVNSRKKLIPVAIQLFQDPGETNPVFLPSDDPYVWLCAKLWFNNADVSFHQSCTHLGFTHLIMEPMCVATHRSLSPSHPIFRLLAPHFLYLLAINSRGLKLLISPGGWVDKCMTIGIKGMFSLISRELSNWRLDVQGTLPKDLEVRGVDDLQALPDYYYRDDALLLYNAIYKYVQEIVTIFYADSQAIQEDYELQEWARCLSASHTDGGVGIPGVHGGGKFESVEELVRVCTATIFITSVAHAAANFSQYDDYGYPPNYPAFLHGTPIRDKKPRTNKDVQKLLPTKDITMDTMLITRLLSMRATKPLGDFEVQYLFDPESEAAARRFRDELENIGKEIDLRNMKRAKPYTYLHPNQIPNSISI